MPATGIRPKGSDGPMYHPERDLAYITPTLMANAIGTLVLDSMRPELQAFAKSSCISQESLNTAVESFAKAQQLYVSTTDRVESAKEALEMTGFYQLPLSLRMLLMAALGETVAGAWFVAVRDVTRTDQDSPAITQMAEMLAAAKAVARLHVDPVEPDELMTKIAELELKVSNRDGWLQEARTRNTVLASVTDSMSREYEQLKAERRKLHERIGWWLTRPFLLRVKHWWSGYTLAKHVAA